MAPTSVFGEGGSGVEYYPGLRRWDRSFKDDKRPFDEDEEEAFWSFNTTEYFEDEDVDNKVQEVLVLDKFINYSSRVPSSNVPEFEQYSNPSSSVFLTRCCWTRPYSAYKSGSTVSMVQAPVSLG